MLVPFVGGSNPHRSVTVSAQKTRNLYPIVDPEGKYTRALYARPGLKTPVFSVAGSAPVRGMRVFGDSLYAVVGGDVKKINTAGQATTLGSIGTSAGPVGMEPGRTQLGIVDGSAGYYTTGSTLSTITDTDFPNGATHIDYIDDQFIVNDPANKGRFYTSDAGDVSSWQALNFATAERDPDALQGLVVVQQQLLLAGAETFEAWAADGSTGAGFGPLAGGVTEVGLAAPFSIAKLPGEAFWLAQTFNGQGAVFRGNILGARISTDAVEEAFAGYSKISDAEGFAFWLNGNGFYVLTFPAADRTWVYHTNSGAWMEWDSYGLGRWRPSAYAFFNGKHYVGDYQDGNIYELSFTAHTDAGTEIIRERQDRHIVDSNARAQVIHNSIEFDFEMGVGTASLNPTVMLSWSDNGGHTWSNDHELPIGLVGKYGNRAIKRRLGVSRDRIYRWRLTDDCPTALSGAFADMEVAEL